MRAGGFMLLGFLIIFVGVVIMLFGSSPAQGPTSTGIVIFIGPFPIVFGSGPESGQLITIGLLISVVMVLLALVSFLGWRRARTVEQPA
jgi:uncharacterized membrane protein